MTNSNKQKLELTWIGKNQKILAGKESIQQVW